MSTEPRSQRPGLDRILRETLGDQDIVQKLSELPAADLATVLMEVASHRSKRVGAIDVLARYRSDRFSLPRGAPFLHIRAIEDVFVGAVPTGWDWLVLSPLVPFGSHAALGDVSQDRVVGTVRASEVAADPTVSLALEAARARSDSSIRRTAPHQRLAAIQRILRAQLYASPKAFVHFTIFALVTAGRSQPRSGFDLESLNEHLAIYVRALSSIADRGEIVLSVAGTPSGRRMLDGVQQRWASPDVRVTEDPQRLPKQRYYRRACFKIEAVIGSETVEIADGGFTDWTERLLADRHERLLISGAGLDRTALAVSERANPEARL